MYNCPNCGAPINADVCPYCGTAFLDWSAIDISKPNWIKLKIDGRIVIIKALINTFNIDYGYDRLEPCIFADDQRYHPIKPMNELDIDISLSAMPFKINDKYRSSLMLQIDPEMADNKAVGEIISEIMKGEH